MAMLTCFFIILAFIEYLCRSFFLINQGQAKSDVPFAQDGNTGCGVFKWGGTKLGRFLRKNQHTQKKLLNFEFWINGELSKIGHHF
jgi:hypothetical protein